MSPVSDPALKRPELARSELAWVLAAKSLEQSFARDVGLLLEPPSNLRPYVLERIDSSPPGADIGGALPVCGSTLSLVPELRKFGEEALQTGLPLRRLDLTLLKLR